MLGIKKSHQIILTTDLKAPGPNIRCSYMQTKMRKCPILPNRGCRVSEWKEILPKARTKVEGPSQSAPAKTQSTFSWILSSFHPFFLLFHFSMDLFWHSVQLFFFCIIVKSTYCSKCPSSLRCWPIFSIKSIDLIWPFYHDHSSTTRI